MKKVVERSRGQMIRQQGTDTEGDWLIAFIRVHGFDRLESKIFCTKHTGK